MKAYVLFQLVTWAALGGFVGIGLWMDRDKGMFKPAIAFLAISLAEIGWAIALL